MNKYTTLIVDDEVSSRKSLRAFVTKYCSEVDIIAEAENIKEAEPLIRRLRPDIVFLDIEMPGGNAFDLLEQFEIIDFEIIFITAFSEYAIRAFELSAAHYLLKPISIEALEEAVNKAKDRRRSKEELISSRVLLNNLKATDAQIQKIVLPLIDGFELVRLNEIIYIQAMDNFSHVFLSDKRRVTVCRKLKYFEETLSEWGFFRIHRSHLVNREYIVRYHKGKGGYVTLSNGKALDVSQSRKKGFLDGYGLG